MGNVIITATQAEGTDAAGCAWKRSSYRSAPPFKPITTAPKAVERMAVAVHASREIRGPVELFLASVAGWDGEVVRLVISA